MKRSFLRKMATVGCGTTVTLVLSTGLAGCGGPSDSGDAVVVTAPGSTPPAAGAPAGGAATPASTSPSPAASPAPAGGKVEGWGTLKGQITFGSAAPDVPNLVEQGKAAKDPQICAKGAPIKSQRLVVDGATKGVKFALVYLPKPTAVSDDAKAGASKADVLFDQNGCVFEPHVLGVMAGGKITLKSSDPVNHNVNARLKNSPFNSLLAAGGTSTFTPGSAERTPASVTCDIHPWMQAWWLVLDNPYFAVTDEKGNYEIKNVPAGSQKVVVWQEATGFVTAPSGEEVAVKANDPTAKDFTIDPGKVKPAQ